MRYIGLMSGTSANGIDGVLVELDDHGARILATQSRDYSPGVKDAIESVIANYPHVAERELRDLDHALGLDFAATATPLLREAGPDAGVAAIGSHGQTVYHGPSDHPPRTLQIGNAQVIADHTGLTTVGDFRSNDMRQGGQGAPLAPAFHNAVFRDESVDRMILNIGGIANLTWLPADRSQPVVGFDTGPASTLMDQWCRIHRGEAYDAYGRWARQGKAGEAFIQALLDEPYFAAVPPKSTGREYFNLDWMKRRYPHWEREVPEDIQAGLLEVTARSIATAAARIVAGGDYEMYACGGGAYNSALMERLGVLTGMKVATTEILGVQPDWVEACAFAWLAHRRLQGLPGNLPGVTGAAREVLLGEVYTPA